MPSLVELETPSIETLLSRWVSEAHDEKVAGQIYTRLYPVLVDHLRMVGRARNIPADDTDLHEIAHQSLLKLLQEPGKHPTDGLLAFMKASVVNRLTDFVRRRLREKKRDDGWKVQTEMQSAHADTPFSFPDLTPLLDGVEEPERSLLLGRFFENFDYAELASRHGFTTAEAVRKRISRSLTDLRGKLESKGIASVALAAAAEALAMPMPKPDLKRFMAELFPNAAVSSRPKSAKLSNPAFRRWLILTAVLVFFFGLLFHRSATPSFKETNRTVMPSVNDQTVALIKVVLTNTATRTYGTPVPERRVGLRATTADSTRKHLDDIYGEIQLFLTWELTNPVGNGLRLPLSFDRSDAFQEQETIATGIVTNGTFHWSSPVSFKDPFVRASTSDLLWRLSNISNYDSAFVEVLGVVPAGWADYPNGGWLGFPPSVTNAVQLQKHPRYVLALALRPVIADIFKHTEAVNVFAYRPGEYMLAELSHHKSSSHRLFFESSMATRSTADGSVRVTPRFILSPESWLPSFKALDQMMDTRKNSTDILNKGYSGIEPGQLIPRSSETNGFKTTIWGIR